MPLKGCAALAMNSSSLTCWSRVSVEGWNSSSHFWIAALVSWARTMLGRASVAPAAADESRNFLLPRCHFVMSRTPGCAFLVAGRRGRSVSSRAGEGIPRAASIRGRLSRSASRSQARGRPRSSRTRAAGSAAASQPRWIQAAPRRPMKRRSPRVVGIGSRPLRSTVGRTISRIVMMTSMRAIAAKNTAVGQVQYIDWTSFAKRSTISDPVHGCHTRPSAKPLAM